jgi:ribonuclease Z
MTQRVLRYLTGFAGLLLLAIGVGLLIAPGRQVAMFAVLPSGSAGLSTVRADLAGLFLGTGGFVLVGAVTASVRLLTVPAVLLTIIAFGRVVNLIADGPSPDAIRSLAVEVVVTALLVFTISSLRKRQPVRLGLWLALPALLAIGVGTAYVFQRDIGLMLVKRYIDQGMSNQLVSALPDGLHVGLCGSGSPMPDATRSGPCVLVIAGRHVFVVDVGEGGPRTLALMGVQPALVEGIFLTHFHSDHIGGLGELLLQRWATGSHTDQTPVHGPQGVESVVDGFNLAYGLDKGYRVAHHGAATVPPSGSGGVARPFSIVEGSDASQVVLQQDGLTVTAFPVVHTPVFPAVGYRFEYGGRSIVISGDTAPSQALAQAAQGVDVLFHEGLQTTMVSAMHDAAERNGRTPMAKITADIPSYHTTPEDAARLAAQAGVKQLVFYHTIPPLPVSYLNAAFLGDARKLYAGPITVSTDGLLLTLTSGTTTITQRNLL